MTKQEFMERLRLSLNGKVSSSLVEDNLQYYEDYINTEIRKGTSESDVMERLGDPRLIARTIVETSGGSGHASEYAGRTWYEDTQQAENTWYEGQEAAGGTWYEAQKENQGENCRPYGRREERYLRMLTKVPLWAWLLLLILIVILAVSAVFSILAALLPILLPVLIIVFVVKAFRDGSS